MLIELHMIQNFAPSNLNRDDTNSPKDCEFGGVRRARISSQCLKRAIRWSPDFRNTTRVDNGLRTRWITKKFVVALQERGKSDEEAFKQAEAMAGEYIGKMEKDKNGFPYSSVLFYYSPDEIRLLVDGLAAGQSPESVVKEMVKRSKNRTSAPDIALFGRMLANDPSLNLDAACQMAHAISTHRVNMDIDFYTAVDDLLEPSEETGAGMMGVQGFNSACFYRYACVDWDKLVENLDGDRDLAARTVRGFLHASATAIPSGKQNSTAAQNMPSLLLAVVRRQGGAISLANAFEKPVAAQRDGGYRNASVKRLEAYWQSVQTVFGGDGVTAVALPIDPDIELDVLAPAACYTLQEWLDRVDQVVEEG
jgi:CRISPR system Cascade subunit CasC